MRGVVCSALSKGWASRRNPRPDLGETARDVALRRGRQPVDVDEADGARTDTDADAAGRDQPTEPRLGGVDHALDGPVDRADRVSRADPAVDPVAERIDDRRTVPGRNDRHRGGIDDTDLVVLRVGADGHDAEGFASHAVDRPDRHRLLGVEARCGDRESGADRSAVGRQRHPEQQPVVEGDEAVEVADHPIGQFGTILDADHTVHGVGGGDDEVGIGSGRDEPADPHTFDPAAVEFDAVDQREIGERAAFHDVVVAGEERRLPVRGDRQRGRAVGDLDRGPPGSGLGVERDAVIGVGHEVLEHHPHEARGRIDRRGARQESARCPLAWLDLLERFRCERRGGRSASDRPGGEADGEHADRGPEPSRRH